MKKPILGLCGPSGAGKGFFFEELQKRSYSVERIISYTTRRPGPGEIEGVHYYFITLDKFNEMKEHGDFFEFGCWGDKCYATPKSEFERIVGRDNVPVLEIGHRGMQKMLNILADTEWDLHPVGILPGELSYDEIHERFPDMKIFFNIKSGIPEVPNERDRRILIDEYQKLLKIRLIHRSRESTIEIEQKVLYSADILEFFLSGKAQELGFKMVSNTMHHNIDPIKELLLRAEFLVHHKRDNTEIKFR